MPERLRLAVIGGDGIGPEVVAEGLKVLGAAVAPDGVKVETTDYDLGARRWHATGETLPDSVLDELRGHDAILLGAVGDPGVPTGVLERGLLLRLRFALDHHVNLRPVRLYPGVATPLAGKTRTTSTWSSSGRAPRARTPAPAACCASARRTRSRPRRASTPRTASSASSATPSPGPTAAAPTAHPGAQDQRARPRRRPVAAHRRRGRAEFPT